MATSSMSHPLTLIHSRFNHTARHTTTIARFSLITFHFFILKRGRLYLKSAETQIRRRPFRHRRREEDQAERDRTPRSQYRATGRQAERSYQNEFWYSFCTNIYNLELHLPEGLVRREAQEAEGRREKRHFNERSYPCAWSVSPSPACTLPRAYDTNTRADPKMQPRKVREYLSLLVSILPCVSDRILPTQATNTQ